MAGVDVVIPCYQYGRFLRACATSVLTQGVPDLRILIIDNASTDDSLAVARRLAAEDPRVEVRARRENLGLHASFNEGIDWARSDYFMVLCADDLLTPGSLRRAVAVMEENPDVAFAYGNDVHTREDASAPALPSQTGEACWQLTSGEQFIAERCRNPEGYIAAGMVLVRTSVQKRAGHYRPQLPHTDDLEMLLRLACFGGVAYTTAVQGIKRMHGANRTNDYLAQRTRDLVERVRALESFFGNEGRRLPDGERLLRLGKRSISERAYWCAVKDLARGRRSAVELFRLAFALHPLSAVVPPVSYLLRMEQPLRSIRRIVMEMVAAGRLCRKDEKQITG
ncbi:MAG TPA: glycosyltransferase family A protein [Hyphomicrobiaceae bacterium]|nr:glycosyltransferase family A protein [Hyphomicrobiaceae bacterium]